MRGVREEGGSPRPFMRAIDAPCTQCLRHGDPMHAHAFFARTCPAPVSVNGRTSSGPVSAAGPAFPGENMPPGPIMSSPRMNFPA
jgi:hypothetical protein